jgi:hypothetical protein
MRFVAALAVLCALALPSAAGASIKIAGDVKHPALRVNAAGWATVTYWKSGSWHKAKVSPLGKITWGKAAPGPDVSKKTDAVSIPFMKQLRVGPTGRYWALQAWQRLKGGQIELRLSRWRGAPTLLELWAWCCKWNSEVVRGRATFHGKPIYGYRNTPEGVPLDGLGRNVYIDTYRGGKWKRTMGILTHRPTGTFGLWIRPYWRGTQYRAAMVGPNWGRMLGPDAHGWTKSVL